MSFSFSLSGFLQNLPELLALLRMQLQCVAKSVHMSAFKIGKW